MRETKFRCWYDDKMHEVTNINFPYEKIMLFNKETIDFKDGVLMQYIRSKR